MAKESLEQRKKEILAKLVISETDTLNKLENLVQLSKPLFQIDNGGKVYLDKNCKFSNQEKIELLLIGKYFASNLGFIDEPGLDIAQLSKELEIKKTTLSAPLGQLAKNKNRILSKSDSGKYQMIHHEIEDVLKKIASKQKDR